jgi:putative redox protein
VKVQSVPGKLTVKVTARDHAFLSDEPAHDGGDDLGATPFEYALAALGGCTVMTISHFIRRKGWQVEDITVELSHEKVDARTLPEAQGREGKVDIIRIYIQVKGPLSQEQVDRIRYIAGRCPVYRMLTGQPIVKEELDHVPSDAQATVFAFGDGVR